MSTKPCLILVVILGIQTFGFGQTFKGTAFILSENYSENECAAFGECDCCTSDIFFLTTDKFCYVTRCVSGDAFFKGTYTQTSDKLKLKFDKKFIREVTDDEYRVIGLESKETNIEAAEFSISTCGQKVRLSNSSNPEWKNGSRYDKTGEAALTKQLMSSKAWKLLEK